MLEVQRFLNKKSLQQLQEEFLIKLSYHNRYPNLVSLGYDNFKSPLHRTIVQECRGLVLDTADDFAVVARGYDKFFNYGERQGEEDELDFSNAWLSEKLDGTFILLSFYKGEWLVSTTGTADASGHCDLFNDSFEKLFWYVFEELNYSLPPVTDYCFLFELMTPYNQVVVSHSKSRLVLHGLRYMTRYGGYEVRPDSLIGEVVPKDWEVVKFEPLPKDWFEIKKLVESKAGEEYEGIVVTDHTFKRLKLKNSKYVLLHHALTNFSSNTALEVFFKGQTEIDEIVAYKPELFKVFKDIQFGYSQLSEYANETLKTCKSQFGNDRKAIGLHFEQWKSLRNPVINFTKGWVFKKLFDPNYEDVDFSSYLKLEYEKAPKTVKYLLLEAK